MQHWARDRARDRLPIEKVVRMQAFDTARFIGLNDRGALAAGQKADINVIDFEGLKLLPPKMRHDLPAGGRRLIQEAEGYVATLSSGEIIAKDGQLTGRRPGRLVRLGQS